MAKIHIKQIQHLLREGRKGDKQAWMHAETLLHKIANQQPKNPMILYMLACMYMETERTGVAIGLLSWVTTKYPELHDAWNALAIAFRREGFKEEALRSVEEALKLNAKDPDALNNAGTIHINEGTPHKAIEPLKLATEVSPAHGHARWNLALALLESEQFGAGFDLYTWGLATGDRLKKRYGGAQWWHGEKCRTLVIYDEQGVGDSVMFWSVLPDLYRSGLVDRIIVDCHPRLVGIIRRSFPWAEVYGTRKELDKESEWVAQWEEKNGPIEYKTAIPELCRYFRRNEADFANSSGGYLRADPQLVQKYVNLIRSTGKSKVVLVSHVGGHKKTRKEERSIPLDEFLPVFRAFPDAAFVSCEYKNRDEDYVQLKEKHGIDVLHLPEVFESERFSSYNIVDPTGKIIAGCKEKEVAKAIVASFPGTKHAFEHGAGYDLDDMFAFLVAVGMLGGVVVTVNNSTVHFCGSLGVPCFTLTPTACAWRYGTERKNMIWYDSVRQFRQHGDNWAPAFDELVTEMRAHFSTEKGEAA